MAKKEKPSFYTDDHKEYLNLLRESGETNMFGATPYLEARFGMSTAFARETLSYWMDSFGEE